MQTATGSNLVKALNTFASRVVSGAKRMTARTVRVGQVMSRNPRTCGPDDTLYRAAQVMWEADCGCVPVVGVDGRVRAMITDRDICMAAYTQGRPLGEISVSSAASRALVTAQEGDSLEAAEDLMRRHQIRRLPVTDAGGRLLGILSMGDLARHAQFGPLHNGLDASHISTTLSAISQPTSHAAAAA